MLVRWPSSSISTKGPLPGGRATTGSMILPGSRGSTIVWCGMKKNGSVFDDTLRVIRPNGIVIATARRIDDRPGPPSPLTWSEADRCLPGCPRPAPRADAGHAKHQGFQPGRSRLYRCVVPAVGKVLRHHATRGGLVPCRLFTAQPACVILRRATGHLLSTSFSEGLKHFCWPTPSGQKKRERVRRCRYLFARRRCVAQTTATELQHFSIGRRAPPLALCIPELDGLWRTVESA